MAEGNELLLFHIFSNICRAARAFGSPVTANVKWATLQPLKLDKKNLKMSLVQTQVSLTSCSI